MANIAKFDREEVIQKATNLYWEKGFHGTSMRNLQDVIDMRPGSIYASFGSKEGLFKEALAKYADMGLAHLAQCQQEAGSPLQALKLFVRHTIIDKSATAPSGMCMLAKTISELTEDNSEVLAEAQRLLGVMENAFLQVIELAQEQGEVSQDKDPQQLARHVQVQIMGLRTYARANKGQALLNDMIDDIFKYHPF
ncbi:TetR/AcrR family transcriptional regulator [Vibrio gallaecicus]|uniref:TetR/AcrR family transcriptional regulator n=1 Tax=Vibrio gallaecicus TaxID=552386 RepID=A0ABV4N873_9VIBR|nr:TetR/AcrR family transcriptional regulator [Vibrio gallaecicus]MDN3616278.1 TetR/AcrR family transcriptional regulator [Vibrio gallaecicus]